MNYVENIHTINLLESLPEKMTIIENVELSKEQIRKLLREVISENQELIEGLKNA